MATRSRAALLIACVVSCARTVVSEVSLEGLDDLPIRAARKPKPEEKLTIEVLAQGNCDKGKTEEGDVMQLQYHAVLFEDGEETDIIDSNVERGTTLAFRHGREEIILGWDQGLLDMCIGEQRKLTIPPSLGYKFAGLGNAVPPFAWMVHYVELKSINFEARERMEFTEEQMLEQDFYNKGLDMSNADMMRAGPKGIHHFKHAVKKSSDPLSEILDRQEPTYLNDAVAKIVLDRMTPNEKMRAALFEGAKSIKQKMAAKHGGITELTRKKAKAEAKIREDFQKRERKQQEEAVRQEEEEQRIKDQVFTREQHEKYMSQSI